MKFNQTLKSLMQTHLAFINLKCLRYAGCFKLTKQNATLATITGTGPMMGTGSSQRIHWCQQTPRVLPTYSAGHSAGVVATKINQVLGNWRGGDIGTEYGQLSRTIRGMQTWFGKYTSLDPPNLHPHVWYYHLFNFNLSCHWAMPSSGYSEKHLSSGFGSSSTQLALLPSMRCVLSGGTGNSVSIADANGWINSGHLGS